MIRALVLAALLFPGAALAAPLACPRTLRTAQQPLEIPAGLVAEEESNDWSNLAYVEFYAGPKQPAGPGFPPVRYAVPPSSHATQARTVSATWDFSEHPEDVWLSCHYHGTRLYLLVPVPPSANTCTVTWGRSDSGVAMPGAVQRIECE